MKKSIKLFVMAFGLMLFFTQCEKETEKFVPAGTAEESMDLKHFKALNSTCSVTQTLWAGAGNNNINNGTDVGTITASVVGGSLYVQYSITAPWKLTEAHLWVGNDISRVPGQAAPGQFPYMDDELNHVSGIGFLVNLEDAGVSPGETIYVAAHGVVVNGNDIYSLNELLPLEINYSVIDFSKFAEHGLPVPPQSYFQTTITGGHFAGSHKGWCIEHDVTIAPETDYVGLAISTYDQTAMQGLIHLFDKPEFFPGVNWLINNVSVGEQSEGGFGPFTMGDIQRALWLIVEVNANIDEVPGGVGPYNDDRVAELVERAFSNMGFIPGCDDNLAVVIINPGYQTIIIEFPVSCDRSETIWGFGDYTFKGQGIAEKWGWIFDLDCYEGANNQNNHLPSSRR